MASSIRFFVYPLKPSINNDSDQPSNGFNPLSWAGGTLNTLTSAVKSLKEGVRSILPLPPVLESRAAPDSLPKSREEQNPLIRTFTINDFDILQIERGELNRIINSFKQKTEKEQRIEIRNVILNKTIPDLNRNLKIIVNSKPSKVKPSLQAIELNDRLILQGISLLQRYLTFKFCNQEIFAMVMAASRDQAYDLFKVEIDSFPHLSIEEKQSIFSNKFYKAVPNTLKPLHLSIKGPDYLIRSETQFALGFMTDNGPMSTMEFKVEFTLNLHTLKLTSVHTLTKYNSAGLIK